MDHWVHYDADGNRVAPQAAQARFRGKEVAVGSGAPPPPGHEPLRRYRYVDVHAIGGSERQDVRIVDQIPSLVQRTRRDAAIRFSLSSVAKGRKRPVQRLLPE
jgi:hypothetical protein